MRDTAFAKSLRLIKEWAIWARMFYLGKEAPYGVIVCGAGHAGCEAALASARMGVKTLLLTGNADTVAQMSCNPAIGGLAKGHIVREIDALGGEMALNADATGIQFRLLNASKGPAVQGPRAQCDKKAYQFRMKSILERAENLILFQAEVVGIIVENGKVRGVETNLGENFYAESVILTTGTFLRGLMHVGSSKTEGGRMGDFAAKRLSESLKRHGIKLERLKTGTPARILGKSIDFSKCALQAGDPSPTLFAFYDTRFGIDRPALPSFAQEKRFENLMGAPEASDACRSGPPPFRSGNLSSDAEEPHTADAGLSIPGGEMFHVEQSRICEFVSEKEKLSGDAEKMFHVEQSLAFGNFAGFGREQLNCYETRTNGRTAEIIRANLARSAMYGGEIEGIGPRYCPSIEDKIVRFAEKPSHRLFLEPEGRTTDEWYINGLSTSMPLDVQADIIHSIEGLERAELLRPAYAVEYDYAPPTQLRPTLESKIIEGLFCAGQINGTSGYEEAAGQGLVAGANAAAKVRGLKPIVLRRHESYIGVLIDDLITKGTSEPYRMFTSRAEYRLLLNHNSAELRLYPYAESLGLLPEDRIGKIKAKAEKIRLWTERFEKDRSADKIRRDFSAARLVDGDFFSLSKSAQDEVLYNIIYKGYLERDLRQIEKSKHYESISIPPNIDYSALKGLRIEAAQKLQKFAPATIGQASRISGVSPADINVLLVYVKAGKL